MSKKAKARTGTAGTNAAANVPIEYADFVLRATRRDRRTVAVAVKASPAGAMSKPISVAFSDAEASRIRESFRVSATAETRSPGRALITASEATELGHQLARVLLPPQVFRLLAESIAAVGNRAGGGLRVRLDLDDSLIDLPWEYLYRPDRRQTQGVSGFLLMDPALSLVRMAAHKRMVIKPITGRQSLNFIGALWEGNRDAWNVRGEFEQLRTALKPVSKYLTPEFAQASDSEVFDAQIEKNNAILHYAGHCDFERDGSGFMIREMSGSGKFTEARQERVGDLARALRRTDTRLVVLSACNSGFWSIAGPLLKAGIPAVIGINGGIASDSTVAFSTRLYESLALGLSLDEAVGRARLAAMEWGAGQGLFDWGLYMVYLQSSSAVLLPRSESKEVVTQQARARRSHRDSADRTLTHARELDGLNFGEIMSELSRRRVLILGRFSARRLPVLNAIKKKLAEHEDRYIPELFTFARPDSRDLVESILGFAALSRFVIADLSEPRSLPQELQAIVPNLQSVPVVPIINEGGREFATFDSIARRPNVVQPTLRYRNVADLETKLDAQVVGAAEKTRRAVLPKA
jgi:CHAT domain-containing protein